MTMVHLFGPNTRLDTNPLYVIVKMPIATNQVSFLISQDVRF